ncbi:MAG: FAD-dependent oxidoreductase [Saprospiraceae bacterium]|nr:FAD-dependent oxidoreductase [Saprospiraceae bacterium]
MIMKIFKIFFILSSSVHFVFCQHIHYPVIIIGGGASGVSAGIHAARSGVKTLIIEEYQWLGGMLTSAGVAAFDGNHRIAGGIWKEFRDSLYRHYGGPKAVETGWVSNTLFEPSIGNRIFKNITAKEKNLTVNYNSIFLSAEKDDKKWTIIINENGVEKKYTCNILIDATETGEVCQYLKLPADIGMDSGPLTGESWAGDKANDIVQDLTYVVILKDYGKGADKTIPKPEGYNPDEFKCCCDTKDPSISSKPNIDCDKMMTYGKLPNGKYMINWPACGNDIYMNVLHDDRKNRLERLKEAKLHTLRYVYYMQKELGFKHLGIADDEYPTDDLLPFIPYHRESRRIKGLARLQAEHLVKPFDQDKKYYRNGVAVGDYPIDHHHKKNPEAPELHFFNIKAPSYNIPMGSLIPQNTEGLIVAEKSISVSNIVNGATRLQPVVLGIGQAAGAIAVQAINDKKLLSKVSIRKVQQQLLKSGAYIMPYIDVATSDKYFAAVQRIGASGILKGTGLTYKWANQTWFYPNKVLSEYDLLDGLRYVYPHLSERRDGSGEDLKVAYLVTLLKTIKAETELKDIIKILRNIKPGKYTENTFLTRYQTAIILDTLIDPFSIETDHNGNFLIQEIK